MGQKIVTEVIYNPDGSTTEVQHVIETNPLILSKTAFQDYAVMQLGGGVTGMTRFTDIMDATASNSNAAVRFAYARYEAADRFEKTNTAALTQIMVGNGAMTAQERNAIIDNWPEA